MVWKCIIHPFIPSSCHRSGAQNKTTRVHKSCKWMSDHSYDSLIRKFKHFKKCLSCTSLRLNTAGDKTFTNPQLWLVTTLTKEKPDCKKMPHRPVTLALVTCRLRIISAIVNISCIGQYYKRQPGRSLQVNKKPSARASHLIHWLLCLLLCSSCDLCLLN